MKRRKPFEIAEATDMLMDASQGDVLLPLIAGMPDMLLGQRLAVMVLTTIDDQRLGIPMGHQAISDLHRLLGEALRMLQAPEGGSVQ